MSIIVKGMEMPENCFECPCCRHDSRNGFQKEQCNLTLDVFDAGYYERFEGRAQNCPLVALPDKHGRLIDENEVRIVMNWLLTQQQRPTWNDLYHSIQEMNAVIEAEEKEDA